MPKTRQSSLQFSYLSLQPRMEFLEPWLKKWKIKINENNGDYIAFSLRRTILRRDFLIYNPL